MKRTEKPRTKRLPYCPTGDSARAVESMWPMLERKIRHVAEEITDEPELQADLVQEAQIILWEVDPTRFDPRRFGEQAYLRRVLINRMWDVWRAEMARRGWGDELSGVLGD